MMVGVMVGGRIWERRYEGTNPKGAECGVQKCWLWRKVRKEGIWRESDQLRVANCGLLVAQSMWRGHDAYHVAGNQRGTPVCSSKRYLS